MVILFESKFTSGNLSTYINSFYSRSLVESEVIFSLKKLEWIAVEELTFLFGWIREVKANNKNLRKIFVELPTVTQSEPESFKNKKQEEETIRRRKTRLISLYDHWKILKACGLEPEEINVGSEIHPYLNQINLSDNNWHSIIPFKAIPFVKYRSYDELRENVKYQIENKFRLHEKATALLSRYTSKSIFDNKTLSNIITTELYLNSLHHSFDHDENFSERECYFSIALRNRIDVVKYAEIKKEEGFTFTKSGLDERIQNILRQNSEAERIETERKYFKTDDDQFRNESFIEFTFFDFGKGIPATLKKKYKEEFENKKSYELLEKQLSVHHFTKQREEGISEDSLVLEYAFLLDSSQNPFSKKLEINTYVPRGLYFLIDMVKRYSGMLSVRSNKGYITYSFNDPRRAIKDCVDFSRNENGNFPGTMISIYIPAEQKNTKIKVNAVERILSTHNAVSVQKREINYMSIEDALKKSDQNIPSEDQFVIGTYYAKTFGLLNDYLDKYSEQACLMIVDFAGCTPSMIDHKIYYYLSNTPKINANTALLILNGLDKGIIQDVQKSIIASNDFLFRPIPCLFADNEVVWIGIKNIEDEALLNELWNNSDTDVVSTKAASDFKDTDHLIGNMLKVEWIIESEKRGNVLLTIPSRDKVLNYYLYYYIPKQYLKRILFESKPEVLMKNPGEIYWTSGEYYQTEFIKFIEKLYEVNLKEEEKNKETYKSTTNVRDYEFGRKVSEFLIRKYELLIGDLAFDYIVSVTLSSQLLASYVRDFYCIMKDIKRGNEPVIVRLANYYEFINERAFKKIPKGKKALVVVDVISTGKLSRDIYKSLMSKADIVGVFALVDSREPEKTDWKVEHYFDKQIDDKTIYLLEYPIKKYTDYRDIDNNYTEQPPTIISIDPVINSPNTMSYRGSDTKRLIYSDLSSDPALSTSGFLKKFNYPEMLWLGHLHNNVAHHSYYFRVHNWFRTDEGRFLVKELISHIIKDFSSPSFQQEKSVKQKKLLMFVEDELRRFEDQFSSNNLINEKYKTVIRELNSLQEFVTGDIPETKREKSIIFYPMYSSSEVFNKDEYNEVFDLKEKSTALLFPLGRVSSPLGWRFTFPPKILNEYTKEYQNAFIIDDGACTGETLMQMIDSVAFLNVKRITVLAVVGRLEDFQREFFTRLQSIKVKYEKEDKTLSGEINIQDRIVPLSIYFGVHFHIQVYPAFTEVCPFCEEERALRRELEPDNFAPEIAKEYIRKRLEEIRIYETNGEPYEDLANTDTTFEGLPPYIPQNIERFRLFEYRDKIGKLASYRSFKEYLNLETGDWEIWIAILLHEPRLMKLIDQILPSLKNELAENAANLIKNSDVSKLKYSWRISDLIRFFSIINGTFIFEYETLKSVIKFASTNAVQGTNNANEFEQTLQYLRYYVWNVLKFPDKQLKGLAKDNIILAIEKFWVTDIFPNTETLLRTPKNRTLLNYFKDIVRVIESEKIIPKLPKYTFTNLKKFYLDTQANAETHARIFVIKYDDLILGFQSLRNSYKVNNTIQKGNWNEKLSSLKEIIKTFNDDIFSHIEAAKEILKDTTIYTEYIINPDMGIFAVKNKIDNLIRNQKYEELSLEVLDQIASDIKCIGDNFIFYKSPLSVFFTKHDAEIKNIFTGCLNAFKEKYATDLSAYKIIPEISWQENAKFNQVNCHPECLERIFRNILSNIVKHVKVQYPRHESCPAIETFFGFTLEDGYVQLQHTQNILNKQGSGGLGLNEIETIIKFFGGSIEVSDLGKDFKLTIKFPLSINIAGNEK